MSMALPFSGVGSLTASPAESTAFGFGVARLAVGGKWSDDVADADTLARRVEESLGQAAEDLVIIRFPSELFEVARLVRPGGRRVQHAGTLLYWEDSRLDNTAMSADLDAVVFRGGSETPHGFVNSAAAVIADSFDGYLNHYSYNVEIPAAVARNGYVDWARRTIGDPAGAAILLRGADSEGAIAVATLRFHSGGGDVVAEVELASVASHQQGGGRYQNLWSVIRRTSLQAGAERLIISTQASNIRVQRAWARLGLVPLASFDTLHAVLDRST